MREGRGPAAFPDGFLWGAATSAYQIEGAVDADGRGRSIWDRFAERPGVIADATSGSVTADHYVRCRDDVALMANLGLRMYRFSVAWPRIQPDGRGPANQNGLDFYRRLVDNLLAHGITPNLSLYHWDLPQALQDAGGWPDRAIVGRFAEYADIVYRALHDRVGWWSTINEPWCVALLGYASGVHAPGERDPRRAVRAIHHVLLAHGLALRAMRAIASGPQHGIVLNLAPVRWAAAPGEAAAPPGLRLTDAYRNRVWMDPLFRGRYPADLAEHVEQYGGLPVQPGDLDAIAAPLDWLGINYYNDVVLEASAGPDPDPDGVHPGVGGVREPAALGDRTDMGWPITPDGLRDLLLSVGRDYPNAPAMIITENGAAYDDPIGADGTIDDARRIRYLGAHLQALGEAIREGADVRGYLVWSLLDNFEWAEGHLKRFGIVHVDFETMRRTPRRSAGWCQTVIERNGLEE